jgi:hypothetical protein
VPLWERSARMERPGTRGTPREGSMEATVASLVFLGIVAAIALAGLIAYLVISVIINREDRSGSIADDAPNRACRGVRSMTGYHRLR